jgi:hypothetical protein
MYQNSYKIPLYFNYVGVFPKLLEEAKASITHPFIDVRVNAELVPVPFTKCLNKILRDVGNAPCFFFMHYDAEVLDQTIFDDILDMYKPNTNMASVAACDLTDLLVLFDTKNIHKLGGWDEGFLNSFMELDLRNRIFDKGMTQPIVYSNICPDKMSHKNSSALRNNTIEGNIAKVYDESYKLDLVYYHQKYPQFVEAAVVEEYVSGKIKFTA